MNQMLSFFPFFVLPWTPWDHPNLTSLCPGRRHVCSLEEQLGVGRRCEEMALWETDFELGVPDALEGRKGV